MGLELTIERSYLTHSNNIHFKTTGLFRRFSRRRNMSSSRIHCCYIVIGTEFKEKHILEQESSRKTSISALLTTPEPLTVDHNKLWKILKEMGIPDQVTCFLRNLCAGQEATVRTGHGTTDWFQIRKGVCQGCLRHLAYLTSVQSTSWEMLGWMKHKLESRFLGEILITSDMQMTPLLWQKSKKN